MLDPYKRNSSDSPITTPNHLINCHNKTLQLLQTLDLDSQRITQSSQAIQSALESINTLFITLKIHQIISQVIQISLIFLRYWIFLDTSLYCTLSFQNTCNIPNFFSYIFP